MLRQRVENQLELAREAYRKAHESNDTDKMFEAQQALNKISIEEERYRLAKNRQDSQQTQVQDSQQTQVQDSQQTSRAPDPEPDPKAKAWAKFMVAWCSDFTFDFVRVRNLGHDGREGAEIAHNTEEDDAENVGHSEEDKGWRGDGKTRGECGGAKLRGR